MTRHLEGIYHIEGPFPFPVQIIVTGELNRRLHTWLTALSGRLDKRDIKDLFEKVIQMTEKDDREMADSVLEVSIEANKQIIEALMGDDSMFETLMEIIEPRINEIRKGDREEGRKEGIQGAIEMLRNLQYEDPNIKSAIMKQYDLTEDEAIGFLRSPWQ